MSYCLASLYLLSLVVKNGLAKPTYSQAHTASYSQLKQLLVNLMSQDPLHYL